MQEQEALGKVGESGPLPGRQGLSVKEPEKKLPLPPVLKTGALFRELLRR